MYGVLVHASAAQKKGFEFLLGAQAVSSVLLERDAERVKLISVRMQSLPPWYEGFLVSTTVRPCVFGDPSGALGKSAFVFVRCASYGGRVTLMF
ncbi:MAG: hypothetical protein P8104_05600 [Gammaproteobacteria bacterium]